MKEAIMDIRDITYSREMYEAKPHPFASAFIYIFLTVMAVSVGFIAIGSVDIVTKASGVVRPNQNISAIKNLVSGDVIKINYENGQKVNKGDVLLVIDHSAQDISKKLFKEKLFKKKKELELLKKYKDSIEKDQNLFDPIKEELYYSKYEKFRLNMDMNKHDINYNRGLYKAKIFSVKKQIREMQTENHYLSLLENSILNNKNIITGSSDTAVYYKSKYKKYLLDYDSIKQRYKDEGLKLKLSQNSELSRQNLEKALLEQYGYKLIQKSIDEGKNAFEGLSDNKYSQKELSVYENLYKTYVATLEEYKSAYEMALKDYELNSKLLGIAVTSSQLEQIKQKMFKAFYDVENYKNKYYVEVTNRLNDLEIELIKFRADNNTENSKTKFLENNNISMNRALNKFKTDTLVALRKQKNANQTSISNLNQSLKQLEIEKNKTLIDRGSEGYAVLKYYKADELLTVLNNIKNLKDEIEQLSGQLERVENEIEQSIIKANISGRVDIVTDIAVGESLFSGTHILTIVPEDDTAYKVKILLNNKDVAKVKVGDTIKYHFQALPYKEYGELTGYITKISTDSQLDKATGQSFYVAEATLNERFAYSYKGERSEVKIGMVCEAQIVTEQKKILRVLLEKINILN